MANNEIQIYHEKQRMQFCLLHALNNLFQDENAFTRGSLNAIAKELVDKDIIKEPWTPISLVFKPHYNVITGNYDVNVLVDALREKGKDVKWHDVREGASAVDLDDALLMGIMLNVMVKKFSGIWKSRHWFALRKIDGVWYNLDSDLNSPHQFENKEAVGSFLANVIDGGGKVLLVRNNPQ